MESNGDKLFVIKRALAAVMLCLMISGAVLSLIGCTHNENTFYTDYFYCMYNDDKTEVTILELTDKGQEQEVLIIPENINGLPIKQLGGTTSGYPYQNRHYLKSDKLKKIYVSNNATDLNYQSLLRYSQISDIIVTNLDKGGNLSILSDIDDSHNIYFSKEYIESDYLKKINMESYSKYAKIANIEFYLNCDEVEKPFFVDNYNELSLYILPEIPEKEGYVFNDWYLEKDCINKWNGNYPQSQEERLNLYAKWVEK
jgi:uncharacterized repeat protein (TIGR02543 family)